MANYIKVTEKVAASMGLTSIRNKTADGNYLLWQADVLRFPGDDIFSRAAYCGGAVLTPNAAKEEVEGMPSPESAEYWERMYKSTLVIYESLLDDLQNRFDELDNSLKQIHSVFKGRREAV